MEFERKANHARQYFFLRLAILTAQFSNVHSCTSPPMSPSQRSRFRLNMEILSSSLSPLVKYSCTHCLPDTVDHNVCLYFGTATHMMKKLKVTSHAATNPPAPRHSTVAEILFTMSANSMYRYTLTSTLTWVAARLREGC